MNPLFDPRSALKDLLNVNAVKPPEAIKRVNSPQGPYYSPTETAEEKRRAQEFIDKYGELRYVRPLATPKESNAPVNPLSNVRRLSLAFSAAMYISSGSTDQKEILNEILAAIFSDPVGPPGEERKALEIDILEGTVRPIARDLLDGIAIELMRSRKLIARCALCSKYFLREWNKDKYCSTTCSSEARRKQQLEWITNKRHPQGQQPKKARKAR